jgi:hypothetical protein
MTPKGTLDLSKFNASLQKSNLKIKDVATSLHKLGPEGS